MAVTLFHKVVNHNYVKVVIKNKPKPEPPKDLLSLNITMHKNTSREVNKK